MSAPRRQEALPVLEAMERLRRLVWGALALAAIATTIAVWSRMRSPEQPQQREQLEARELRILDQNETLRVRLTSQGLILADGDGKLRATISTGDSGVPTFSFFGKDGRARAILSMSVDDNVAFEIYDSGGRIGASLRSPPDALPSLVLYDKSGMQLARLPATPEERSTNRPPVEAPGRKPVADGRSRKLSTPH